MLRTLAEMKKPTIARVQGAALGGGLGLASACDVAIASTKAATVSALKAFSDKPVEDIAGLGKAAFFVPGIDQLTVFIDDARMITLSLDKVPDGASGKDIALALAKKAGA